MCESGLNAAHEKFQTASLIGMAHKNLEVLTKTKSKEKRSLVSYGTIS